MKTRIRACILHTMLAFCCSAFLLQLPAKAQSVLEQQVSLNLDHITLQKALETLESSMRVKFVYSVSQIDVTKLVSVDENEKTLAEILDKILLPLSIEYKMQDNNEYIVLAKAEEVSTNDQLLEKPEVSSAIIKGRVTDEQGIGLVGVNVLVKGTRTGTSTDVDGKFSLQDIRPEATLIFSFIGFSTSEIEIGNQTSIEIILEEEIASLNEVVVTAMGIARTEKSLTYGTQRIDAEELTRTKTDNLLNTLNGRVLGVTLFPSASGLGGSAKVILRGNRSFSQSNQPLYVLDGLPILNSSNANGQPNSPFAGPVDGGDGVSNLNPDDIESMTILKGASASALYGSQAANGAVLITTKQPDEGDAELQFNSNISVNEISYEPLFQQSYGRTGSSTRDSWGPPINSSETNKLKEFFQRGINSVNSINMSVGSMNSRTYTSFAHTRGEGTIPKNTLTRNNFTLHQTQKLLKQKLVVDAGLHYITQKVKNTPAMGLYFNPLTGLYLFPTATEITPFREQYEFPGNAGYQRQHWVTNEDIQQNPWWIIERNPNNSVRRRLLLSGKVALDLTHWLNVQVRGSMDRIEDQYTQNLFSGTQATLSGPNGQFIHSDQTQQQKYADALFTFKIPGLRSININGLIGGSITDGSLEGTTVGPGAGLIVPNEFIAQNIAASNTVNPVYTYPDNHSQLQTIFTSLNVSFAAWLYLNFTGRNDWSSNLSFTPNLSYFYPSIGVSVLLNDALKPPPAISYFKLRANYAEVGNTVPQYVTNPVNAFDNTGSVVLSTIAPFETLKPERTKTYEVGTDIRVGNHLSFVFNYYRSNTFNQFIRLSPSVATGYSVRFVNAGNVQNSGVELSIGVTLPGNGDFGWSSSLNLAKNKNKIIDVDSKNGIEKYLLTTNDNTNYQSVVAKGGSYGDIYGISLMRDNEGRIVFNEDGTPRINNSFGYLGNPNPDWIAGWDNTFTYKKFTLNFLIDTKIGGQVFSMTQAIMDHYGVSKETGDARNRGFVEVVGANEKGQSITQADPQKWYTSIGGRQGASESYIYSANVARVREVSIAYSMSIKKSLISRLRLSVTGRNLFYLYRKAPYDPELVMSTGNGMSGIDIFNQPAVRNIGFALNVTM